MGKRSREKREARFHAASGGKAPDDTHTSTVPRRYFIEALLGAGAGVAAYKYWPHGDRNAPPLDPLEDATDLYAALFIAVGKAYKEAKAARPPKTFRIFVGENHFNTASLVHEIMLINIAKKLGITSIMVEDRPDTTLDRLQLNYGKVGIPTFSLYMHHKWGELPKPIDSYYATERELYDATAKEIIAIANEEIKRRGYTQASDTLFPGPSINGHMTIDYRPEIYGRFTAEQKQQVSIIIEETGYKVQYDKALLRNTVMIPAIETPQDSLTVVGTNHLPGILSAVRAKANNADMCFYPSDAPEKKTISQSVESWLKNPANKAHGYAGKSFPPMTEVPAFVEQAIVRAEERYKLRPGEALSR